MTFFLSIKYLSVCLCCVCVIYTYNATMTLVVITNNFLFQFYNVNTSYIRYALTYQHSNLNKLVS